MNNYLRVVLKEGKSFSFMASCLECKKGREMAATVTGESFIF